MRTSAPTHYAFGPNILIGPFVYGRFPVNGVRDKPLPYRYTGKPRILRRGALCAPAGGSRTRPYGG